MYDPCVFFLAALAFLFAKFACAAIALKQGTRSSRMNAVGLPPPLPPS